MFTVRLRIRGGREAVDIPGWPNSFFATAVRRILLASRWVEAAEVFEVDQPLLFGPHSTLPQVASTLAATEHREQGDRTE
jgi:hypothetical protein